jgi:hypothetical protein
VNLDGLLFEIVIPTLFLPPQKALPKKATLSLWWTFFPNQTHSTVVLLHLNRQYDGSKQNGKAR